ncbi:MAG: pyruvate kinase [Desulfobacterales bacterium]|nr:pyruvate kinase [Desulfobacterales bacterium]
MSLTKNKTKIVCTIGPASESPAIMAQMIQAGMNVARLNFSHGDFESHKKTIGNLRRSAQKLDRRLTIMADLPGPKIRIGELAQEPIELKRDDRFTLTSQEILGDHRRVSVTFVQLPQVVAPGDKLYLNDGIIRLEVIRVEDTEIVCKVIVGGILRSHKGLNLPGINLGICAFTGRDLECLEFALKNGVQAVSQSFVETETDIVAVRKAAEKLGYRPFIIAKIERARALDHLEGILREADGIMIARGDLGVEMPIEQIAVVQKQLVSQANRLGKPVITATQMLESMTNTLRPTRAEATDVANAILDGTDCVMLSGESAMGRYPVEAVEMLAGIAAAVEPHRSEYRLQETAKTFSRNRELGLSDLIASSVERTLEHVSPAAVIVPTQSGYMARNIARFRLPIWITAVSSSESTCHGLQFSYGVYPVHVPEHPDDWKAFARNWLDQNEVDGNLVVLTEGPSSKNRDANNRMELIVLNRADRK